ncbi:PKD domain-containing protein [Lacibacter luteus]|nr:PKD domain-containing protein [Lacibacter luteus]
MLPVQVEFPKFVADQLLTSEDLNDLFGYLDEQNRITRTNLIGIGIVCGLQVQVNAAQSSVTITKGCAVTSEGYLITVPTNSYTQYKKYKVDTPQIYDKFYKTINGSKVAMDIWELKKAAVDPDLQTIDAGFLKGKVIMLFVELKEMENKNCDPNSCDDKGINIEVSFLPMAVDIADAALLMGTTAVSFGVNTFTALPEIRMKRWDVPNTSPVGTDDIFKAYFDLLSKNFIDQTEATLSSVYTMFGSLVAQGYASNPFAGLSAKFSYLYNGSINQNQLIHLQYHYDLFSDLLLAYDEFRKAGTHVLSTCCPDSSLFPRHVLLGEAIPSVTSGLLPYRHYFIYSPLFDQKNMLAELKLLFKRLVLLTEQFFLPPVTGVNSKEDEYLRITPSMLWDVPLSQKAIPYYYVVNSGPAPLYLNWSYRRSLLNDATRSLSYHAKQYNSSNDFVREPLNYDLEPYNFLRIEGIVGKPYTHVLKQVKQQIQKNRLPVDIIALTTETGSKFSTSLQMRGDKISRTGSLEMLCHFQDLESMYDSMRREILCSLCKELKYYYDFSINFMGKMLDRYKLAGEVSQVELFDVCSKGYKLREKSLGLMIELLHRNGLTDETLTLESFLEVLFGADLPDVNNDDIPDGMNISQGNILLTVLNFFKVPLGIIRLSTLLTEDLAEFDVKAYCDASNKLAEYAKALKAMFDIFTNAQRSTLGSATTIAETEKTSLAGNITNDTGTATNDTGKLANRNMFTVLAANNNGLAIIFLLIFMIEDLMDHLDVLIYNCKCSALSSLKKDYLRRYQLVSRLRQFGYFSKMHPGLQHKAGVPMGGTFVIVYHAKRRGRIIVSDSLADRRRESFMKTESGDRLFNKTSEVKERTTAVAGVVVDESNTPIPGAVVSIAETGEATVTSMNGAFKFTSSVVPYTIVVEEHGYDVYEEEMNDDATNMRIVLTAATADGFGEIGQGMVIADFYLPYRCCSDCPPIQYIVNEPATPPETPNKGPVANAGPDQTIVAPLNKISLDGTASTDPDGVITFYQWTKLSGPGSPSFTTATSSRTDVIDLQEGTYEFELSVTDDKGSIARDSALVIVLPAPPEPNKPPVADAGADQSVVLSFATATSFILDGSNSKDEDGSIVAFNWSPVSGPNAIIETASLVQTVVKVFQVGKYEFQLKVTDNDGDSAIDNVIVEVVPPENKPPVANAGADRAVIITATNRSTTLDGSASSDPEGGALQFEWKAISFPAGTTAPVFNDAKLEKPTVKGIAPGAYEFGLTVTDNKGASATDTVVLKVEMQDIPQQKVCDSLVDIIGQFRALPNVDTNRFSQFREVFQSYSSVESFFKLLTTVVNKPTDDQLALFAAEQSEAIIARWLAELHGIITNPDRAVLRIQALFLYRVLTRVAMYIVCIQKEDFDVAKVPMARTFTAIRAHVKEWTALIAAGSFSAKDVAMVKEMGNDMENEFNRTTQNGEAATKPKYLKLLKTIIDMIKSV